MKEISVQQIISFFLTIFLAFDFCLTIMILQHLKTVQALFRVYLLLTFHTNHTGTLISSIHQDDTLEHSKVCLVLKDLHIDIT